MTKLEFIALCNDYLIDLEIALENENIREALRTDASTNDIKLILEQEF